MSRATELLVLFVVALGLFVGGVAVGWKICSDANMAKLFLAKQALLDYKAKAASHKDKVITKYVDRVHVIHEQGRTITKKVKVYVPYPVDRVVPFGFVRVLNAAARGEQLPETAGSADAKPSGVQLSTVASNVAGNYTTCRAVRQQLISLQDWVKGVSQ